MNPAPIKKGKSTGQSKSKYFIINKQIKKTHQIFNVNLDEFNGGFMRTLGNEGIMPNPNTEI